MGSREGDQGVLSLEVDVATTYQSLLGIGASGAWTADPVGKHWYYPEKEKAAELLFSKEMDWRGSPKGIGLSRWRFNIGAGSFYQGKNSYISEPSRRSECFMVAFDESTGTGTYNWNKHKGQQWFLEKAKDYGVEQLLAFANSPPIFMTKNGRANTDDNSNFSKSNLKSEHYDAFALFLVEVLGHFERKGIHFEHISPINEPQYGWQGNPDSGGQEGCPYINEEASRLYRALDKALTEKGVNSKILIGESGDWKALYETYGWWTKSSDKIDLIRDYFDSSRTSTYIGDLKNLLPGIASHSYWVNNKDNSSIQSVRSEARELANEYGIELYQSEYCLLGDNDFYPTKWENSLYLSKIIHADFTVANTRIWDYWTAMARERWGQRNRFYLLELDTPEGWDNYEKVRVPGKITVDKNLWVLGHYSRFIRPGYKRVSLTNANDYEGLFGSSWISPNDDKIVLVLTNWSRVTKKIKTLWTNLPSTKPYVTEITPYVTNKGNKNMEKRASILRRTSYSIAAQSIVTLVVSLSSSSAPSAATKKGTCILG